MALALKVRDLDEDTFAASAASTKQCSGCDPDVPGHCPPQRCLRCRGTGMEPLSFHSTMSEISASKKEAAHDLSGKSGRKYEQSSYAAEGDDDVQDLEY